MKIQKFGSLVPCALLLCCLANFCHGQTIEKHFSPYVQEQFPRNLYWGDTHLHTALSADAYGFGARLLYDQAYALAKGGTVTTNTGQLVRLQRPLDFLVITDHAEYLGVSVLLDEDSDVLRNSDIGQRWLRFIREGKKIQIMMDAQKISTGELNVPHDMALGKSIWRKLIESADSHNDPENFTAFIGYEWTSLPGGNNLHRNIIFRDDASKAQKIFPFSAIDSRNPEDLWQFLGQYEKETGGRVMAIPHNGNVSNGLMFKDASYSGKPLTRELAEARERWEPLVEVTQIKGDGETHPYLSPDDEFADFETWDAGNFSQPKIPKEDDMLQYEYTRSALRLGLEVDSRLGVNPFQFGVIGSSDSHTALSAVAENNFFGKFGLDEPSAKRAHSEPMPASKYSASGYAAVWASENTREALFDAMLRREVYATTGPRITVRYFGGWGFDELDASRPDIAVVGYQKGVPMGGSLSGTPPGAAPVFLLAASKDPKGANLDRLQIVKGWLDAEGKTSEKVYNVKLSDNRQPDPQSGAISKLKSSVAVTTATYTNSIGAASLSIVWTDPDFDPGQRAFYYARVLEIPTPRWTTYDSAFYGSDLPDQVPVEIQERAYTTAIWYTPES